VPLSSGISERVLVAADGSHGELAAGGGEKQNDEVFFASKKCMRY